MADVRCVTELSHDLAAIVDLGGSSNRGPGDIERGNGAAAIPEECMSGPGSVGKVPHDRTAIVDAEGHGLTRGRHVKQREDASTGAQEAPKGIGAALRVIDADALASVVEPAHLCGRGARHVKQRENAATISQEAMQGGDAPGVAILA